jgi:hypothetical protein
MFTGRCLCGGFRYTINRSPRRMYYCHCSKCRRSTGSSFSTAAIVNRSDFSVIAGQRLDTSFESAEGVQRHFCCRCGSPLYSTSERSPETLWISCGTLDDDPLVRPSFHRNVGDRAPWVEITDDLEKFEGDLGPEDLHRLYFSDP